MASNYSILAPDVLFVEVTPPFDPIQDTMGLQKEIARVKPQVKGTLFVLSDFRTVKLNFSDLVVGMAQSTDKSVGYAAGGFGVQIILIGNDAQIKDLQEYYQQDQYGKVYMPVFATLEEGHAFIATQKAQS
jgi:hypothetical protein